MFTEDQVAKMLEDVRREEVEIVRQEVQNISMCRGVCRG